MIAGDDLCKIELGKGILIFDLGRYQLLHQAGLEAARVALLRAGLPRQKLRVGVRLGPHLLPFLHLLVHILDVAVQLPQELRAAEDLRVHRCQDLIVVGRRRFLDLLRRRH